MEELKELEKLLKELKKTLENDEENQKEKKEKSLELRKKLLEYLKTNKPEALMFIDNNGLVAVCGDGEDILCFLSAFVSKIKEGLPEDMIKAAVETGLTITGE